MPRLRLLVVDDNDEDVALLKHAFAVQGVAADFVRATDGPEAVEACANGRGLSFHVIVLDHYLPKMNGGEVALRLKEMGIIPGVPVVLFTAHLPPAQEAQLKEVGTLIFVEKPNDFDGFCQVVSRIVDLGPTL